MLRAMRALLLLLGVSIVAACDPAAKAFPPPDPALVKRNQLAGDPYGGRFPLEEALAGLSGDGPLRATFVTSLGEVHCTLGPDHAPLSVANFVGLARGLRPFRNADGEWVKQPFYDGVSFHRAQPGQFVQVGRRDGQEGVGYWLADEVSPGDDFSRAGVLAVANEGAPDTGGGQVFITTGKATHLEGVHTVLGECEDAPLVRQIETATDRGPAPVIERVVISRSPS